MERSEAIKVLKDFWSVYKVGTEIREAFETLIPELKESEDERIMKNIITFLDELFSLGKNTNFDKWSKSDCAEWIAWLKKQGERKPILPWRYKKDNTPLLRDSLILNKYGCLAKSPSGAIVSDVWVLDYDELAKLPKEFDKQGSQNLANSAKTCKNEPKFKVGDWVIHGSQEGIIYQVEKSFLDGTYRIVPVNDKIGKAITAATEDAIRLWTIQDAKDGDVLSFNDGHGNNSIELIKSITDKKIEFWFCFTNGNHYEVFDGITPYTNLVSREDATPATKEQCDQLEKAMADAGYRWNPDEKKMEKIEQNPAWSEEDEHTLKDTIYFLDTAKKHYASTEVLRSCIEWLKSLKGRIQSQCRPSEGRQTIAANKDTEGVFGLKKNGDLIHYSKVDAKDKDEYESIVIVKGHTCIKIALHNPKGEFTFDEAQKAAASLGEGWRCPTRHEWIDIYDSRFNGLDELIDKLGGDKINGWYWTCEDDADPQYSSTFSWSAGSVGTVTNFNRRDSNRVCAVSAFQN